MTVRVDVEPTVIQWALDVASTDPQTLPSRFKVTGWLSGEARPTLKQLQDFARATGVPFGYLLLKQAPVWTLPVPDFREGIGRQPTPSADLVAVLGQSQRRQAWYRDYAIALGDAPLQFVGSASQLSPEDAAARIRTALDFEVGTRRGSWDETRRKLLRRFEALGGLTVATSIVGNNTHRRLDAEDFRGFSLIDDLAPLVFVNTAQTLNGQIFTLAHEFAHVWRGIGGIGNAEPRSNSRFDVERWCNAVASEVLVPETDLMRLHRQFANAPLVEALEGLAREFKCGTLVVLQGLQRTGLREFEDFPEVYEAELARVRALAEKNESGGGNAYKSFAYRIGERLSRALIAETLEGRTSLDEAMRLMSLRSLSTFDRYVEELGAA